MATTDREQEWTLLMQAAIDGDDAAYRRLLESLTPALRSLARRGLERAGQGNAEVEDIVQETLLAIHLKRNTWDRSKSIGPWVTAIARYKLIDCLRRKGRRDIRIQIDEVAETLADTGAKDGTDGQDVNHLLAGLKDRQQEIVRSIAIEGRSAREAAGLLGMTEVAVRVSLHRSLRLLAEHCRKIRD